MPRSTYCVNKAALPLSVMSLSAYAGSAANHTSAPKQPDLIIAAPRCTKNLAPPRWTDPSTSDYSTNPLLILNKNAGAPITVFRAVACLHRQFLPKLAKCCEIGQCSFETGGLDLADRVGDGKSK
jgi:hypothetical protein